MYVIITLLEATSVARVYPIFCICEYPTLSYDASLASFTSFFLCTHSPYTLCIQTLPKCDGRRMETVKRNVVGWTTKEREWRTEDKVGGTDYEGQRQRSDHKEGERRSMSSSGERRTEKKWSRTKNIKKEQFKMERESTVMQSWYSSLSPSLC